jgi:hypothetical protein
VEGILMQSRNPYAPSVASLAGSARAATSMMWRDGKDLVLRPGGDLPDVCVKCNEPSDAPTKARKLYWHHPGYYGLLVINVILYIIVAMIARKSARLSPGLCLVHKRKRMIAIAMGWLGFVIGMIVSVIAGGSGHPALALLAGLVMLGLMIASVVRSRIVHARRIDDRYIRLKGCGAEFLDSLPELTVGTRNP